MKIAVFGNVLTGEDVTNLPFFSDRSLWDYEAACYDLQTVVSFWVQEKVWAERGILSQRAGNRLVATFRRRAAEFDEFLKHGHPVLMVPSVLPSFRVESNSGDWVALSELGQYFPACGHQVEPIEGERVEIRGSPEIVRFGKHLEEFWQYGAWLKMPIGTPCFFVPKANHVLGSFLNENGRWLLVCPRIRPGEEEILRNAFEELYATTSTREAAEPLPNWHAEYRLPGEAALASSIQQSLAELERMSNEVEALQSRSNRLVNLKRLFTDKGSSLVEATKEALEGLGFTVEFGPEGRDDLIATIGEKVAVIEVKGRDRKSAAESDTMQLEKWVIRHYEAHQVVAKGILIANPFRELPLQERREEAFPEQMLSMAVGRGHCLVTGLQLLCLYFEAQMRGNGAACAEELLSTTGRFQRYRGDEWRTVIT